MMDKSAESIDIFNQGFNCAQAILAAFAPSLGLSRELALKIATGMGAGFGFQGKTCGAVIGAYLVIGLLKGSTESFDESSKKETYNITRQFDRMFEKKHGSIECSELLKTDISTEEGYRFAMENSFFETKCQKFVEDASLILEQLINENSSK